MELAASVGRLAQFVGAAAVFGWPLFQLYGFPSRAPHRRAGRTVVGAGALAVVAGALVSLSAQAAAMTGAPEAATDLSTWGAVLSATTYGHGLSARLVLGVLALGVALVGPSSRRGWSAAAVVGGLLTASFAWTGHAAGGVGPGGALHQVADIAHLLAAGAWLGALPALAFLSARAGGAPAAQAEAHQALARFSGIGGIIVAVLVASGLVNSWHLVGFARLGDLPHDPYGRVLLIKLALFVGMLGLAGANRYILTPRLAPAAVASQNTIVALRASLLAETALGLLVLTAVSILGVMPPPAQIGG